MTRIVSRIAELRQWRVQQLSTRKTVGFVPTMGALHHGHLKLVEESLKNSNNTIVSIFVNPAQKFAPHEDLDTYPRTLKRDIEALESLSKNITLFTPNVQEIYPNGIQQDANKQVGAFVEMLGLGNKMEGISRPHFFRGVATIVTKLFNVVQPDLAYFGQKDVQQALILKRMCRDLLVQYPTSQNLKIVPTARDSRSNLALSSRNAYLSEQELIEVAPLLYKALNAAKEAYDSGVRTREGLIDATRPYISRAEQKGAKLDYLEVNDATTFEVINDISPDGAVLSAAMYVGKTRLIDNLLLGLTI